MKRILKRILDWVVFLLTGGGEIAKEAMEAGILDYGYGTAAGGASPSPTKERGDEYGT